VEIDASKDSIHFSTAVAPANAGSTTIFTNNRLPGTANITETEVPAADYSPALYVRAHNNNYHTGRNGAKVTHVTIHTTQGSYASAISWFRNAAAHMSAHYIVRSTDGQVTQMVNESDMAYHMHSANPNTIGIVHEGYMEHGNKWYSDKLYRSSAALVRNICTRRAIDETSCYRGPATAGTNFQPADIRIKGHQHYSGNTHTDPGKYWNWNKYADLLLAKYTPEADDEIQFMSVPNGIYRITNVNSKKVMNTRDCSGNQLVRVTQTAWSGRDCQRWRFEYTGDGCYRITNLVSGRALDVPGGSKQPVQIQLKDTKENDSQLWRLLEGGSKGEYRLVNKASGKVLEVFAGSAHNGAAVLQSTWNGKSRQRWTLAVVTENDVSDEAHRFRQVHLEATEARQ
jgi:N-acetyl-anhydromuramyl-L-alanine amidase AmpD